MRVDSSTAICPSCWRSRVIDFRTTAWANVGSTHDRSKYFLRTRDVRNSRFRSALVENAPICPWEATFRMKLPLPLGTHEQGKAEAPLGLLQSWSRGCEMFRSHCGIRQGAPAILGLKHLD